MTGYIRPVDPTDGRICSWYTHTHRVPPSQEAGVDYYCPVGTLVQAAGNGKVVDVGGSIYANTGRFVTIDLDDGRRVRYLHLSVQLVRVGQRVNHGDVIAKSGASGYGSEFFGAQDLQHIPANTGGPHVHTTLWPTHRYVFGATAGITLDFELYVDHAAPAGGGTTPFTTTPAEEDDMLALKIHNGTAVYCATLGRGVFRHLIGSDNPERVKNIVRSADDWQDITIQELPVYLWTYGCDLNIWDVRNGDFAILNPLDGSVKAGGMWSAENATRAAVKGIPQAVIDYSAIAKAVNDDFAKRIAS